MRRAQCPKTGVPHTVCGHSAECRFGTVPPQTGDSSPGRLCILAARGKHMRIARSSLLAGITVSTLALCGFTITTTDPDEAEIVTSDVVHFWQAFDDAAK